MSLNNQSTLPLKRNTIAAPQLIEIQAALTPDNIAVIGFDDSAVRLTYANLNRQANQLAHYLHAQGVGPETLVGVCLPRSPLMVTALLAVLKAGGAFLPLDPAYPADRLAFMLTDSAAPFLLTQSDLPVRLPATPARRINLDADWPAIAAQPADNPVSLAAPNNLAYVMYTSGSTGHPKGVMVEHRSLLNYVQAAATDYNLTAADRVLQFAALSWDTSLEEIFPALTVGATLMLRPDSLPDSIGGFWKFCRAQRITVLNLPTAFWHELAAQLDPAALPPELRLVIIGGEAARPDLVARWLMLTGPHPRLVNTYGLTEATAVSLQTNLTEASADAPVPIGRPFAGTGVHLLDDRRMPVPPGQVGELYLSGPGLARGYLHQPNLTARRFIHHSFDGQPPTRLYRTGDLARRRPDGQFEFMGRADRQVKIRGHRIEPDEIETVLCQHPAVSEAVVIVRDDSPGGRQLVAYVVGSQVDDLSAFLRHKLPAYMQPATIVPLTTLPRTPNGKIDWTALPSSDHRPAADAAPRTPAEQKLAALWAKTLELESVGRTDNFFDLGGHSLLAIRLAGQIQQTFAVDVTLRDLFDRPTVAQLAALLDDPPPVAPLAAAPATPQTLSFAQERLWFLEQLWPRTPVHNIPLAVRLRGPLDVPALTHGFNQIRRRHTVLRLQIRVEQGRPRPITVPFAPQSVPLIDLQSHPDPEAAATRLSAKEAARPFNLGDDPLLRLTFLRLGHADHLLLLTVHHLIADDWSVELLWRDLSAAYRGQPLPDSPFHYADFVRRQRDWLTGSRLQTLLDYWQKQLANPPPALSLPTARPRPPRQTFAAAEETVALPHSLVQSLRQLAQSEESTLFMVMLAAFQTLLARYSGQTDIWVGVPIANRPRPELADMVGMFANTLVLRADLSAQPTFRQLLAQVRQTALAAYQHQDLPFELLVDKLQPARDPSRSPLFQVMFVFEQSPLAGLDLPGLSAESLPIHSGAAAFDLTLFIQPADFGLTARLEYNTNLFDAEAITRMLGHYCVLLTAIAAHADQPVTRLPLLTAAETNYWLRDWNNTRLDYPRHLTLPQLFEAQVQKTPDAVAIQRVNDSVNRLTYHGLNEQANRLAHYLRAQGVGPETLVGVCLTRSPGMVTALLAVLKAGGAYVPLDPAYPADRLAFMLADSAVQLLLTEQALLPHLPAGPARPVCLDADGSDIAAFPADNPPPLAAPDNLAYVMYTSGSTGQPKGVMIPHRGLVNYLHWAGQTYPLDGGRGAPLHSSIAFDLTVTALFGPLLAGRPVYLLPEGDELEGLSRALQSPGNFSLVKLTPSHLQLLNRQIPPAKTAAATRAFIIGGENLLAADVAFWRANAPDTMLINEYGPTETVVGCAVYRVTAKTASDGSVPIGRPIANTQIYLLDDHAQPVPVGVPGEIYIGGDGVARGYLNRPELTAAKFIPDPFSLEPGRRLYRTGDLARHRSDGNLEFLGRRDRQIKLRGYRIELAEIEAALHRLPGVQAAAVQRHQDHLAAYVVFQPGAITDTAEIRRKLQQNLPNYMVPTFIVPLPQLPQTPNGKVDRAALPPPQFEPLSLGRVPPQGDLQTRLLRLWQAELKLPTLGVTDNFFETGGHSLLAVRLFAGIEAEFGQRLPVATIFEAPTVAQLSEKLHRSNEPESASSVLVPIQPHGSRLPFFCVHGMGGGVIDYTGLARHLGPDQPFFGVQDLAVSGSGQSPAGVEAMAARYIAEIQTHQPEGPYFLGGYCFGGTVAFEMACQLQAQGQPVALLAILDNTAPNLQINWAGWPLGFLRNIPHWLKDFGQLSAAQQLNRLRRKWRIFTGRLFSGGRPAGDGPSPVEIEAAIDDDLARFPVERHRILAAHFTALQNYRPQPYPGPVTLLRTQGQSLLGPFDHTLGWQQLAAGGVIVKQIPGFHADILREPYVAHVARHLQDSLNESANLRISE